MKTNLYIYQQDGKVIEAVADLKLEPSYYDLKAVVEPHLEGQQLEHVRVLFDPKGDHIGKGVPASMFVGETSAIEGSWRRNEKATAIYRANWLKGHPNTNPDAMPGIYGPAILIGRDVWK